MKAFIGVTDRDWWEFLRLQSGIQEVNFWQPSGSTNFRALSPGQPFLFKLHYPTNMIVGGGFFAAFSILPISLAWDTFGLQNGAPSYATMRRRVEKYRSIEGSTQDYMIGCIILNDPFFLDEPNWVSVPGDFGRNIVRGKGYDLRGSEGAALWERVIFARGGRRLIAEPATNAPMFGDPVLFRPRLGQGGFRVAVTDAYGRRCAVTGEKTLPVLEAAHIRPVAAGGRHELENGLLLRSDIHTLFDRGYVTVTPDHRFRVSPRLRSDWSNGRVYYALENAPVSLPGDQSRPAEDMLAWHADSVFLR